MTGQEAYNRVAAHLTPDFVGRFYSPGTNVGLGKGTIFNSVLCPIFDPQHGKFLTVESLAYVLTHECDIEAENERSFNEELLICPILRLEDLVGIYESENAGDLLPSFLGNLGARNVSRLLFLPPIVDVINFGGVLYLNQITHTHASTFARAETTKICAVTANGLHHIETGIENHLLRPKADRLAFAGPIIVKN